jgi:hypothetical protein
VFRVWRCVVAAVRVGAVVCVFVRVFVCVFVCLFVFAIKKGLQANMFCICANCRVIIKILADEGPSGSQFIALRTRVPVEVVRPRSQPGPRNHYSPGPVRNFAVGGRDLLKELNTWVNSLPERPTQQPENELGLPVRAAPPIRAVLPPPLSTTIDDSRQSLMASSAGETIRDPVTGRALPAPTSALTT